MFTLNARRLTLAALLTAALFAPVASSAQLPIGDDRIAYPLLPDDPDAQLNPEYRYVPAIPQPQESLVRLNASQASREIAYEVGSGQTWVSELTAQERFRSFPLQNPVQALMGMEGEGLVDPEPGIQGSQAGQRSFQSIIGTDDRVRITSTSTYPWRTMCKLYMKFPNNKRYIGSGILIANKYVLTAGHCVHSSADGGWAKEIEVIPGLDGSYKPYGSAWATKMRTYTGWTQNRSSNHDFALITLNKTIGNSTGWLGCRVFSNVVGVMAHLGGYPGDKADGKGLYYHRDQIASQTTYRVSYPIDTMGGQSGSGVYRFYTIPNGVSKRYVFAVHTTGSSTMNSGTLIDSTKFNSILSWINSGQ